MRVYDSYAHHPVEIAGDLRPRARRRRRRAGWSWPSSRTSSRAPASSAPAMGEALGAADEVVVLDVYLAREDADPEVTGALVADAVPLPPERVTFVPDLADVPGRAGRPGPRRRPGAHPRRRQRHRGRPAGAGAARGATVPMRSGTRTDDTGPTPVDDRPAQPQAVRPPAVGAALAGLALVVAVLLVRRAGRRLGLAGVLLRRCSPSRASRSRAPDARCRRGPGGRRRARRASRWPGSTSTRSGRGSRRWRVVRVGGRHPAVARRGADRGRGARCGRRRRHRRAVRGMDEDGVVFREYRQRPAGAAARADRPRNRQRRAAGGARGGRGAARGPRARVDHVEVATVDQITLVLRDGRTVMWGSAEESDAEGGVLRRLLRAAGAASTTSACPAGRRRPTDPLNSPNPRARGVSPRFGPPGCLLSLTTRG